MTSTTSDESKMKLTEKQNIMASTTIESPSPVKRNNDLDKRKIVAQFLNKRYTTSFIPFISTFFGRSLKETLLNNAEQLLNANHVHASAAEVIESMPDHCQLFIDAENVAPPQQVHAADTYVETNMITSLTTDT